jgi:hypothetical protein
MKPLKLPMPMATAEATVPYFRRLKTNAALALTKAKRPARFIQKSLYGMFAPRHVPTPRF